MKAECRKMKADLFAGRCDMPTGVNSLTTTGTTQPTSQTSHAPGAVVSMVSSIPRQQIAPVCFPSPVGSQSSQQTEPDSSTCKAAELAQQQGSREE